MLETILEVSHLTVRREGQTVVEDVSFQLAAESDTALVGPNGAGKSSLVQAVVGVLPRHSGSVRLLGHPLGPRGQLPAALRLFHQAKLLWAEALVLFKCMSEDENADVRWMLSHAIHRYPVLARQCQKRPSTVSKET